MACPALCASLSCRNFLCSCKTHTTRCGLCLEFRRPLTTRCTCYHKLLVRLFHSVLWCCRRPSSLVLSRLSNYPHSAFSQRQLCAVSQVVTSVQCAADVHAAGAQHAAGLPEQHSAD